MAEIENEGTRTIAIAIGNDCEQGETSRGRADFVSLGHRTIVFALQPYSSSWWIAATAVFAKAEFYPRRYSSAASEKQPAHLRLRGKSALSFPNFPRENTTNFVTPSYWGHK
jgi:hypothetical protein